MDLFSYQAGHLRCEDVDLGELAREAGTPLYVYSKGTLTQHYDRLAAAFGELDPLICFSVKSCPNIHVLRALVERGAGLDVVSGGELHRARLAGAPMARVVYAGVGKTDAEIADALGRTPLFESRQEPIGLFNVESEAECEAIRAAAGDLGVTARIALRINPDVDPHTHQYTTTGTAETKFGVGLDRAVEFFDRFADSEHLDLCGLHLHIGSPVYDTAPYIEAVTRAADLIDRLDAAGHNVSALNLGGGFAADYETGRALAAAKYAEAIVPLLRRRVADGLRLILEPGRTIAANAGVLLTRVQYVKHSARKKFAICDAGMHTLLRPPLYGSFHFIWPATVAPQHTPKARTAEPDLPGLEPCDVVGPVCESADFLAKGRLLPPVARGDLLAVFGAGAYGMSMASRYNSHPLPAEVLIDGRRATIIRRRETYDDLVHHEREPQDVTL